MSTKQCIALGMAIGVAITAIKFGTEKVMDIITSRSLNENRGDK